LNEQRARGETTDQQDRSPAGNDRNDEKQRWDEAVARHGFAAADAANRVLIEIEQSREAMERAEAGDHGPDKMRALKQELDAQLIKAAELGAGGNGLIREVAEVDDELKNTLQAVERERQKVEREKTAARSERSDAASDPERGAPNGGSGRDLEVQSREIDGEANERDAPSQCNVGDTTKGDPAKQHVPRLEELQREADERNERDRDDRER
jgi:hypothetical protein